MCQHLFEKFRIYWSQYVFLISNELLSQRSKLKLPSIFSLNNVQWKWVTNIIFVNINKIIFHVQNLPFWPPHTHHDYGSNNLSKSKIHSYFFSVFSLRPFYKWQQTSCCQPYCQLTLCHCLGSKVQPKQIWSDKLSGLCEVWLPECVGIKKLCIPFSQCVTSFVDYG